jgi:DNA repair exonuclease SbcCD ATPase subunit
MELYDIRVVNFGPYEEFELPLLKQGLVWIGGINNDTESADSNGSGKSSIFKALTWGLYGDAIDGEKGDKVIRDGTSKAVVDIRLIDENKELWTINRQRSKGAPRIKLLRPNGDVFEGDKQEIQERIIQMVGLDFKTFKNTVLYGQNDSSRFANPNTKDSERKLMLHRILNTELLESCHKKALEESKTIKNELQVLNNELDKQGLIIDEIDVESLEQNYDDYEEKRNKRIEIFKNRALEYRGKAKGLLAQIESEECFDEKDLEKLKNDISKKQIQIDKTSEAQKKADSLFESVEKLESEYGEISIVVKDLIYKRNDCLKKLDNLKGDKCPVCLSSLNKGEAARHIVGIKNELDEIQKNLKKNKAKMSSCKIILDSVRAEHQCELEQAKKYPKLLKEVVDLETTVNDIKFKISNLENKRKQLREKAKSEIENAKYHLKLIDEEKEIENPYIEQLEAAKVKLKECGKRILAIENQKKDKNVELSYSDFWVKGFSNKGLPSFILDSIMPYITNRTNHYLEILSDGDITLEFSTQRELKSSKGEMRDEIELRWTIEGNEMYPPSGGQLKKIEIASDLALMDLVSSNEGGSLDIIMLDEVLDGLDSEGCSRVLLLLQKLRAGRGSIFVISHESKMQEAFEKGLYAVKNGGITTLEKV